MKKFFSFLINWGVLLPLAAIVVSFALSNRQVVTMDLWPLDMSLERPLYLVVLLAVLAGFVIGLVIMWITAGRARAKARRETFRAKTLERQLADLQAAQERASEEARSAVPASSAGGPPALPASGRDAA